MIAAGPPAKRPPHIRLVSASAGARARGLGWFGTVALVLLLALSPVWAGGAETIKLGEFIPLSPPQPAPQVAFTDADGRPASLADFAGKPAVVNLWATWCQPCLKEMPSLERLQAKLAGKLTVAAVSQDRLGGKLVNPFVVEQRLQGLKIYLDPKGDVARAFEARGLPTSIVLDRSGRVVGRVEGPAEWDSDKMIAVLQPLLDEAASGLQKASNPPGR
jgi:thiol-disulfide isomerase/thioredoxin